MVDLEDTGFEYAGPLKGGVNISFFENLEVLLQNAFDPMIQAVQGTQWKAMNEAFKSVAKVPPSLWQRMTQTFKEIGMGMLQMALITAPLTAFFTNALGPLSILTDLFGLLGTIVAAFLTGVLQPFMPYIAQLFGWLAAAIPYAIQFGQIVGTVLLNSFQVAWATVKFFADLLVSLWEIIQVGVDFIKDIIGAIQNFFQAIINGKNLISGVIDGIIGFFEDIYNAIMGFFKGLINGIIGIINKAIGFINTLIPGTKADLGTITPLANGGIAMGPVNALIGEAGPEVVQPLDQLDLQHEENVFYLRRIASNTEGRETIGGRYRLGIS